MAVSPRGRERTAAMWMLLASLLFATMALLARRAARHIPSPEVALVRFLVGIAACLVAATRVQLRATNWRGLILRGAFGGAAVLCFFLAIEHLTVGLATLLNYTAPVFTALWAALFLGERLTAGSIGALGLTTLGVAWVIVASAPPGSLTLGPWQWVGMSAAVLSGAAVATIREVRRTDGSWEIFASFCMVGALVTLPPAVLHWRWPSLGEWAVLLTMGVVALIAQLMMTYSLRYLRAALAGILMQLTPVAALAAGVFLLDERLSGGAMAGAAVTLLGVSWGAWIAAAPTVQSEEP